MVEIKEPPSVSPNTLIICHLCMKTVSSFSGFGICFFLFCAPEKEKEKRKQHLTRQQTALKSLCSCEGWLGEDLMPPR